MYFCLVCHRPVYSVPILPTFMDCPFLSGQLQLYQVSWLVDSFLLRPQCLYIFRFHIKSCIVLFYTVVNAFFLFDFDFVEDYKST